MTPKRRVRNVHGCHGFMRLSDGVLFPLDQVEGEKQAGPQLKCLAYFIVEEVERAAASASSSRTTGKTHQGRAGDDVCSSTLWTGYLKTWKSKEELTGGTGGENLGKQPVYGTRGESFSVFSFSPVLNLRQAVKRAVSLVAKNQGEFHLFNQKTRKMQAGEDGGRSPPSFESWVSGQQILWRARLAGGAGS